MNFEKLPNIFFLPFQCVFLILIAYNMYCRNCRSYRNLSLPTGCYFAGMSRSSQLEVENKRLSVKVEEMKEICTQTSSLNVKYKMQLEREKESKEELLEGNSKLKIKANELATRCFELNEKIRVLESNLKRSSSASVRSSRIPVKIIGNVSEIVQQSDPKASPEYIDLESKYADLERDYQEALAVIDELDFELDDVREIFSLNMNFL